MGRRNFAPAWSSATKRNIPMSDAMKLGFAPFATPAKGILIVFCDDELAFGSATR